MAMEETETQNDETKILSWLHAMKLKSKMTQHQYLRLRKCCKMMDPCMPGISWYDRSRLVLSIMVISETIILAVICCTRNDEHLKEQKRPDVVQIYHWLPATFAVTYVAFTPAYMVQQLEELQTQIKDGVEAVYSGFRCVWRFLCCRTSFQARIFRRKKPARPETQSIMLAESLRHEDADDDDDDGEGADEEDDEPEAVNT